MKYLLLLLVFPMLSASECGSKKDKKTAIEENTVTKEESKPVNDSIPVCVRKMIDDTKGKPGGMVKVDEYIYKKHTVYLMTADCCDQYNILYDNNCKPMCAPSGGFVGSGDGKCKDFADSSKFVKLIWKRADN